MFDRRMRIQLKSPDQLAADARGRPGRGRRAGGDARAVAAGVTTAELDAIADDVIRAAGATPSFLGYHGFPATICASVNDEVVHGIPIGEPLHDGDLVSLDCGAILDGWHGDAAITVPVGEVAPRAARADAGHRGVDVARHRGAQAGGRLVRHRPRRRDLRPCARAVRHRRGVRRARHRHRDAPGPARAQPRPARPRARAPGRAWRSRSSRWSPRPPRRPRCSTTTGPSSPSTARSPAHFEHSIAVTADGPRCSPRREATSGALPTSRGYRRRGYSSLTDGA